jgi:RNA polymerase sigma-70 factor (ECF subfamily)
LRVELGESRANRESRVLQALVDRAKRGDAEAFDALARLVGDDCMAIAFRILRDADQADDAVQSALIIAWRELRTLRDPDRFEAWMHRILINECFIEARRRRRWSANLHLLPPPGDDASDLITVNDRDQLERAFRRLTLEQSSVLVLHYYVGLTAEQVAGRLGIPVGTVKSRIHHATDVLRASLEADARTPASSRGRFA